MTTTANTDYVGFAGPGDVAEIAALSVLELPTMTALHEVAGWSRYSRFGNGGSIRGNYTAVLRDGSATGALIGFIWADSAMTTDYGLDVPWWCINAIAIAPAYRGAGRGTRLVAFVQKAADQAGVQLLYGQSVPEAVKFWEALGWDVAHLGESLRMPRPVRRLDGGRVLITLKPGPGDRFFLRHTAHTTEPPGLVRDSQFQP